MSCEVDLKAYVVGEVTRNERGVVEDHVRGCQSCREELDRLNLTRSMLASLEDEEIRAASPLCRTACLSRAGGRLCGGRDR